eukprot:CAMPEP_0181106882 /NCGR_PEP_ID=MMETSP1071-20121207/16766_1 /TAXON_ID=35127 /ORGANISM="Thalassiosira sp., Strain NH16" /LENGTH=646 /DNA_ID=CAMNT_0023190313 /DNA_START=82 /DNA_END=2022 /DNA_ORIENTATION=-
MTMAAIGAHARRSVRIRTTFVPSHSSKSSMGGELGVRSHCRHDARSSSTLCNFNIINSHQCNISESTSRHHCNNLLSSSMMRRFHCKRFLAASARPTSGGSPSAEDRLGEGTSSSNSNNTRDDDKHATSNSASSSEPVKMSMDELLALASCHPTALSLEAMYRYAPKRQQRPTTASDGALHVDIGRLRNAQFLHKELPIRIAQRAIDLLTLPHGLNRTREVQSIANTFIRYLQELRDFPFPTNAEAEERFTSILKGLVLDRHSIPMAIARGLQSLKDDRKAPADARRLAEMEEALNRFFTARVGLRFLVEHHVLSGYDENSDALYRNQLEAEGGLELLDEDNQFLQTGSDNSEDCCGAIQKNCDPVREVRRTVARVTKLCRESYGIAPEIEIVDCTPDRDAELPFTYVPHHLRYMLAELLKNSCRATVRNYLSGANTQKEDHTKHHHDRIHDAPSLPPVKVIVTKGAEDVTVKIADRGGGMPRSVTKRIWTFAHSTLSKERRALEDKHDFGRDEFTGGHIRGFGLPLARIYARYFGGEVTIKSMEGYGVDAYLYLPVLGVACENLPQRVIRSPGNLDSTNLLESANEAILDGDGYYDPVVEDSTAHGSSRDEDFFEDTNVRQFDSSSLSSKQSPSVVLDKLGDRAL